MKKLLTLTLLALTLTFSACSEDRPLTQQEITHQQNMEMQRLQGNQQIQAERAANPNYSNGYSQPMHQSSGASDMLVGMAVGSMLSNNGGSSTTHTTVNNTYKTQPTTASTSLVTPTKPLTTSKPSYQQSVKATSVKPIKPKYRAPVKKAYNKPYSSKPKYRAPSKKSLYKSFSSKPKYRKKR